MKTVIRKNDVNYPQDRIPSSFDSENVAYGDTNVKEKLDEISSNLSQITASNIPSNSYVQVDYPSGFNRSNTYVISIRAVGSDTNYFDVDGYVRTVNGGIRVYNTGSSTASYEALLQKYT